MGLYKIVYKRYASLYFKTLVDKDDNELIVLELIYHFVEYFRQIFWFICELDIIFDYHNAYYIVEEIIDSGYIQESDNKSILKNYNYKKKKKKVKNKIMIDYYLKYFKCFLFLYNILLFIINYIIFKLKQFFNIFI